MTGARPWAAAGLVLVAGLLAIGPATAQSERTFDTVAGQAIVVGLHPSVKDDCSRGPLVEIVIASSPRNGAVAVQGVRIAVEGVATCPPIEATARRVVYRPELTFSGTDRFSYRTTDYLGRVKLHAITILVKPRGKRRFDDQT